MAFLREMKKLDVEKLMLETGQFSVVLGILSCYLEVARYSPNVKTDKPRLVGMIRNSCKQIDLQYTDAISTLAEILGVTGTEEDTVLGYISKNISDAAKKVTAAYEDVIKLREIASKMKEIL